MKRLMLIALTGVLLFGMTGFTASPPENDQDRLAVLWTSGDPEVARKVCLMYTHAAKQRGWFNDVLLVVWGPSARLLAADEEIQAKVKAMAADGVQLQACKACSDSYGVSGKLTELGVEVKFMGEPLTTLLKDGWRVLTF